MDLDDEELEATKILYYEKDKNMKTARGVYLNLSDSDYFTDIDGLRFFFSSEFNKKRFDNNIDNFIEEENQKINNKYHVDINLEFYLMIVYYKKIEKRGFRIRDLVNLRELKQDVTIINAIL